jgi:hypothetical protein
LRISTPRRRSVSLMDSSDPNTTQEPAGMVTSPESLAIAPRRVDRGELVGWHSRGRTKATSSELRTHSRAAGVNARHEPGTWKTLGTIVFDAPSELAPRFDFAERGNPLALTLAIAAVVAMLTVVATTAFLVPGPTPRPNMPAHISTGDRIRAFQLVRGNQAQLGDWARRGPAAPTR